MMEKIIEFLQESKICRESTLMDVLFSSNEAEKETDSKDQPKTTKIAKSFKQQVKKS